MSFSLVFSQGKKCCKNKAAKNKVACKFNQANLDINKDGIISNEEAKASENLNIVNETSVASSEVNNCNGCKKAPWWKFWAKKVDCCKA